MKRLLLTLLTFLVGGALGVVLTLHVESPMHHAIARCDARTDARHFTWRSEWDDYMQDCLVSELGWTADHAERVAVAVEHLHYSDSEARNDAVATH